jgi:hypothetical protein
MTADRNAGIFASSTETPLRSRSRIFTCRKMKIATSPFVYRGAHVFMPEKLGNLQHQDHRKFAAVPAAENRRAHNERGGFKRRACSATADDSPLFRVKDQRDPEPVLHARPALRVRRDVDCLELAAVLTYNL